MDIELDNILNFRELSYVVFKVFCGFDIFGKYGELVCILFVDEGDVYFVLKLSLILVYDIVIVMNECVGCC